MSNEFSTMVNILASIASVSLEWKVTARVDKEYQQIMIAKKNDVVFPDATAKAEQKGILALFDLNRSRAMISTTYTSELEFFALVGIAHFHYLAVDQWDLDIPF